MIDPQPHETLMRLGMCMHGYLVPAVEFILDPEGQVHVQPAMARALLESDVNLFEIQQLQLSPVGLNCSSLIELIRALDMDCRYSSDRSRLISRHCHQTFVDISMTTSFCRGF